MPFSDIGELPYFVRKNRTKSEQRKWLSIFNETLKDTGSETAAFKAANGALNLSAEESREEAITCFASDVFKDAEASGLYKVQALRTGLWKEHPKYGDILIDNEDLAEAVRNFRNSSRKVFLDYNHGITSAPASDVEGNKAIGFARDMYIETLSGERLEPEEAEKSKEKVLCLFIEYEILDEEDNENLRKKKYALYSPTFFRVFRNEETGEWQGCTIVGGAATNIPYFNGMEGFVALTRALAGQAEEFSKMFPRAYVSLYKPQGMKLSDAVAKLDAMGFEVVSTNFENVSAYCREEQADLYKKLEELEATGFDVNSFSQGVETYTAPRVTATPGEAESKAEAGSSSETGEGEPGGILVVASSPLGVSFYRTPEGTLTAKEK